MQKESEQSGAECMRMWLFETSVSLTWFRRSRQRLAHLSVDTHLVRRVETRETNCGHLEIILGSTFSTVSTREVVPLNGEEQCKTLSAPDTTLLLMLPWVICCEPFKIELKCP